MAEPIVGKPSGWKGQAEEYTKNEGSVGKKRIVFVGASYKFVHKVLRDMLLVGGFNDVELVVHDIDETPMNIVADLLERIARQKKTNVKVLRTLNRDEALKGADAVVLSITIGGREADYRSISACLKYGIPIGIGDTLGPNALARNLREVPVVVDLARAMEKICPKAVMLNFTNPMSVITGAIARYTPLTSWGLCHSADELFAYFARVFGVKKPDVKLEVGGVNHQAFVTKLWIKGEERTADILPMTMKSDAKLEDNLLETRVEDVQMQQDICKLLGAWPSTGHTHLAEFYPFFFTDRRLDQLGWRREMKTIDPCHEPFGRTVCPQIIHDWAYGPEGVGDLHLMTTEHSHELLWAYFTGQPFTRVLNLLNTGNFIAGLPKHACVEALVTVSGNKVTGQTVELPPAILSLVHRWTTIHDLSIQAAMECDRDAARQALFLDPHVKDLYDIEPLLEDMLKATQRWLPGGWFTK
ncbi:MAG TPA: hypothetical protein VL860_08260 [Planctomycetota bacterium]|nr:hypothetical protein [Planctomycetota bacterium]